MSSQEDQEVNGLQHLLSFPVRLGLTWSFPCRPKLKALLKAARNCGSMMPYITGFAKLLVNIRQATVIKILLGIKHPAVSTITTIQAGPHVIKNVQTTVKLVFKSFISVRRRSDGDTPSSVLWACRF